MRTDVLCSASMQCFVYRCHHSVYANFEHTCQADRVLAVAWLESSAGCPVGIDARGTPFSSGSTLTAVFGCAVGWASPLLLTSSPRFSLRFASPLTFRTSPPSRASAHVALDQHAHTQSLHFSSPDQIANRASAALVINMPSPLRKFPAQ